MEKEKAEGFLILLQPQSKDQTLAFMALTDGNVVDAFVGAPAQKREGARYLMARDAKLALSAASGVSERIPGLAVETYQKGILTSLDYQRSLKSVFFCCRCFVQGRFRRKAKRELKECFSMLQEAVAASSSS
jgi:hypothetical protein